MRTSSLLVAVAAAISTVAAYPSGWKNSSCLCEWDAKKTADNVQLFFANYTNDFARALLTPNLVDYTDSVQFLENNGTNCPQPLGTATFPNRTSLIAAQGGQGSIPWQNTNVFWDCENVRRTRTLLNERRLADNRSQVFIRWESIQQPFTVRGISIFRTC